MMTPDDELFSESASPHLLSEINVTPFVDVMLVLLVVFMVTAPLLTVGVRVNLPRSQATALTSPDEPLVVSLTAEGEIFLQERAVPLENLSAILLTISRNDRDARIYIRGDRGLSYERVMAVMGEISAAGFRRLALLTLPGKGG